jgi:hypothetical protein
MGILGLFVALSGCVASGEIKSDTLSFDDVIEDTTNKLLLLNVLRARDKAPLHFADIPVIRESMQMSASLGGTRLFGPPSTTLRNAATIAGAIQKSPSFEVNHLDSKDFITGISSPIDVKFVKYWLDRGLDRRIVLLLFFSAVEIVETRSETGPISTIRVANSPRDAIDVIRARKRSFAGPETLKCDAQSDFERYLKLINVLKTFFAHSYKERRVLAKGLSLDSVKDNRGLPTFAALDQSKIQLSYDKGLSAYNLYALSPEQKVAFCFYESRRPSGPEGDPYAFVNTGAATSRDKRSCSQSVVDIPLEDSTRSEITEYPIFFPGAREAKESSDYCAVYNRFIGLDQAPKTGGYPKLELKLHIRSVGEIFQFLGDLLHYQDEIRRYASSERPLRLNTPVTFGYCPDDGGPGCDDVFFRLDSDPALARFSLLYRDKVYSVGNLNPPEDAPCEGGRCPEVPAKDHTLEILSVVHQLVDLNKSATDIRATPFVQALP